MQRAHAGFAFDLSGRVRDSGGSVVVEMCDLRRKMAMTDLAMALACLNSEVQAHEERITELVVRLGCKSPDATRRDSD